MIAQPVRLQLSRKRGFNLQALSLATNGLPAVNVARPHRWGNAWKIGSTVFDMSTFSFRKCITVKDAVQAFRQSVDWDPDAVWWHRRTESGELITAWGGYGPGHRNRKTIRDELRAKNLACWCASGAPCHADVLLVIANAPICEAVLDSPVQGLRSDAGKPISGVRARSAGSRKGWITRKRMAARRARASGAEAKDIS
jgi:hypothetical protein